MNPKFPSIPSMSTYKSGSDLKRKYIKTAKSVVSLESDDDDDADAGDRSTSLSDFEDEEPDVKRSETGFETGSNRFQPIEEFGNERPNLSYSCLIALAIQNSPEQKLTLGQIYSAIMDLFPYYKSIDKAGWQNSIRHNLSLNKAFVRKGETGSRSGAFWTIDPVLSIGSFKKIRRFTSLPSTPTPAATPGRTKLASEKLNQVSTQTNESFWEPDPDTFDDSLASSVDAKAPSAKASAVAESAMAPSSVDRRQSIEEFLQMGLGKTPEKRKVKILSSLDIPTVTSSATATTAATLQPSAASASAVTSELDETHRQPFMGSIDFYEQYDPDVARDIGQALITTEKLPIEWLCFLCGSAGREEMVFCRSCCEPFHPFCLVRFSLILEAT